MFFHTYKYALLSTIRCKAIMFWTLLFPLFLGTVFYFSFGRAFENAESFSKIPVALVEESENEYFRETLTSLSEGEDALFQFSEQTLEEAETQLRDGEITGIFLVKDEITLIVKEEGTIPTIMSCFLEQYLQTEALIEETMKKDPSKVHEIVTELGTSDEIMEEINNSEGNMNIYLQYFYALIGMSCLYALFLGEDHTVKLQADLSALGQRRSVAPTHKMQVILSDFCACITIQFGVECILLIYLIGILGLDFGTKIPAILLLMLVGSSFGVALGILLGSIPKVGEGIKLGLGIVFSMICSFLSGLMFDKMRNIVENHCPIINKLNPGALIVDSFYALNLFDTYNRYWQNLGILALMTVICCFVGYLLIRRNTYASL